MLQFEDIAPAGKSGKPGTSAMAGLGLQSVVPDGMTARARPAMQPLAPMTEPPKLSDTAKLRRVNIADKRIINGQTDVNQIGRAHV